jgi:hypothetical protein
MKSISSILQRGEHTDTVTTLEVSFSVTSHLPYSAQSMEEAATAESPTLLYPVWVQWAKESQLDSSEHIQNANGGHHIMLLAIKTCLELHEAMH